MGRLLIFGASRGVGRALAENLANSHEFWTVSRRATHNRVAHPLSWDATGLLSGGTMYLHELLALLGHLLNKWFCLWIVFLHGSDDLVQ